MWVRLFRCRASVTCLPLKIIGCIFLVSASSAAGWLLSKRLSERCAFLQACHSFLRTLQTELRYRGEEIFKAVSLSLATAGLPLMLKQESDKPFFDCWKQAIAAVPRSQGITSSDVAWLTQLGAQLGKTDLDGQLSHLSLMEAKLTVLMHDAQECIDKKARLYKTMGFFVGVSAAILML